MIDIHNHVLYGIDDGASDLEESIEIIRNFAQAGYTKIIATPHYIENTKYTANNNEKKERLNKLTERIKNENLDIQLFLGNEIFIEENIIQKIVNQDIYTMNNSEYILVELPMDCYSINGLDVLSELNYQGAKVLLAHPERYSIFQENPKEIEKYLDLGILLQGNIDALSGKYGKKAKKVFIKFLKERKYFALASDVHKGDSSFFKHLPSLKKEVIKLTSEDYWYELIEKNPMLIIDKNAGRNNY